MELSRKIKKLSENMNLNIKKIHRNNLTVEEAEIYTGDKDSVSNSSVKSDIPAEECMDKTNIFRALIENISQGVLIIDRNRKILQINEVLANLFYLDPERIIGLRTIKVFNNKNFENLIARAIGKNSPRKENVIFYGEEDMYLEIEVIPVAAGNALTNKEDRSEDYIQVRDILILFRNATQEVEFSKLRSQFAANISHEMRTPLTSIKGYLETILEDGLAEKERERERVKKYLESSLKEVDRLNFLIKDVLDLSKIEFRRNVLFEKNCDLVEIIGDCIDSLSLLASKNNIEINFNYNDSPVIFKTDEELFSQMVRNILENSIFYAGNDSRVSVFLNDADDSIILDFKDNGIGISKKDIPFIFQRFYRGESPLFSKRIGSGLGLSIVKHTVELHGGKIEVSSAPGKETVFHIVLPKKEKTA